MRRAMHEQCATHMPNAMHERTDGLTDADASKTESGPHVSNAHELKTPFRVDEHGSNGYRLGCRCDTCRGGHRDRMRRQRERRNPRQPLVFPNPEIRDHRVPDRIWTKVRVDESGCWVWTGSQTPNGYGQTKRIGNKHSSVAVHRLVFELLIGPIPDGLQLDHLCRVRECCNPEHLEPVTGRVNVLRGDTVSAANAKKTHCDYGHPFAGENLRIRSTGARACATCDRRRMAERKERIGIEEWRRQDRERWHARKAAGQEAS